MGTKRHCQCHKHLLLTKPFFACDIKRIYFRDGPFNDYIDPLPHSDAIRQQKKKIRFRGSFQLSIATLKKYITPTGNLKFIYLGVFQNLKLRILFGKNPFNFSSAEFHTQKRYDKGPLKSSFF